jgi:WD40 repeat protein
VGHQQRIHSVAYTQNHYAVTCSEDGDIKTWYLAPLAERELIFEDSVRALAVSTEHDTIAYSLFGDKGFFYLWHWPSNTRVTVRQPIKRFDRPGDIIALAYTGDGKGIVAASENTLTTFIDRSGRNRHEDYRGGGHAGIPLTSSITAVDVNDDYILIADRQSGQVLLRDRKDPAKCRVFAHPNRIHDAKFSPDDRFVLSGGEDGIAYLWDIQADSLSRKLEGHRSKIVSVDFSPDGRYLLTGSYDNTAMLFELVENHKGNLSPIFELEGISASYRGHTSDVNAVAFSQKVENETYRFTTAGADKSGKIWQLNKDGSLHELPSLIRHLDEVTVAAFLPGDSLIVTGGFDETLKVWQADGVGELIDRRVLDRE